MNNDRFISIESITSLGEILCCVYIFVEYEVTKAIQYLRWKGLRVDLLYRCNNCLIFYQDDRFVPDVDEVDHFYREVDEDLVWSKFDGYRCDYKYRVISRGVVCISYLPSEEKEKKD